MSRARNKSSFARPYICRFINLSFVFCPSCESAPKNDPTLFAANRMIFNPKGEFSTIADRLSIMTPYNGLYRTETFDESCSRLGVIFRRRLGSNSSAESHPLPSQVMCVRNRHLLRVGPFTIARRYS
jgi:hypothetical protein